jgi:SAM-dependent methyltransferase
MTDPADPKSRPALPARIPDPFIGFDRTERRGRSGSVDRHRRAAICGVAALALATGSAHTSRASARPAAPIDVPYVPTSPETVAGMLDIAQVGARDVVYDLGSGDGRIPIAAARRGARAVGIDIDPDRIAEARLNAAKAGVSDRVRFVQGNLFEQDLSQATVITLYLLPRLNLQLRPTLLALVPGTRIVSHGFDMGDWRPDRTITAGGSLVHFWRVPQPGEGFRVK